jgi:hypothetical protein
MQMDCARLFSKCTNLTYYYSSLPASCGGLLVKTTGGITKDGTANEGRIRERRAGWCVFSDKGVEEKKSNTRMSVIPYWVLRRASKRGRLFQR